MLPSSNPHHTSTPGDPPPHHHHHCPLLLDPSARSPLSPPPLPSAWLRELGLWIGALRSSRFASGERSTAAAASARPTDRQEVAIGRRGITGRQAVFQRLFLVIQGGGQRFVS